MFSISFNMELLPPRYFSIKILWCYWNYLKFSYIVLLWLVTERILRDQALCTYQRYLSVYPSVREFGVFLDGLSLVNRFFAWRYIIVNSNCKLFEKLQFFKKLFFCKNNLHKNDRPKMAKNKDDKRFWKICHYSFLDLE